MKKILFVLAAALTIQSCTRSTFYGSSTGMWAGATIGGAIGGLMGGHRGHDFGTVIGVITGAAAGAIAANAAEAAEEKRYEEYVDDYNRSSRYSNRSARKVENYSSNRVEGAYGSSVETVNSPLKLRNLRFIDDGGNQTVNRAEDCKIIFELCNNTDETVYDVIPFVSEVNGNSHVFLSPSTRIEAIKAGDVVRYTCSLRADKKLSAGTLKFRIAVSYAEGDFVTLREFTLPSAK